MLFSALLHSSSSFSPPGQLKKLIEIKNDIVKSRWLKKQSRTNQENNQEPVRSQLSSCLLFLSTRSSETTKCWEVKVYALLWVSILSICVLFFRLVYLRVFPLCLFCLARWLYFLANGHKYDKYWAVSLLVSSVTVIICVVTRRFSLKECYVTTQTQPLLAWRHNERLRRRLPKWWLCIYFYVHFDPHVRFVDFVAGHVGLRHFFEP